MGEVVYGRLGAFGGKIAVLTAMLAGLVLAERALADEEDVYPSRPIKIVVPFGPGGGSDTFGRVIKAAIEENNLLPQPVVIINVEGAGGTIGSRRVKNARPDGYTVLFLHDALITAKYAAKVNYGPEAFLPVAATGRTDMVIAVRDDSPHVSLDAMLDHAGEHPGEITFAANLGAPTHFVGLLMELAHGKARFQFTQIGGGANRFAAIKGGHVDLTAFSLEEFLRFRAGGIRSIALLSENRNKVTPEMPTAIEQGVNVVNRVTQCWWMPRGTPPERARVFAAALVAAMQTDQVRRHLEESKTDPVVLLGDELRAHLEAADAAISAVDPRESLPLPNLPMWVVIATCVTGVIVAVKRVRSVNKEKSLRAAVEEGRGDEQRCRDEQRRWPIMAACSVLAMAYGAGVTLHWLPLGIGTTGFVFAFGTVLASGRREHLAALAVVSVIVGLTFHVLFTRLFVIDL